MLKIIEEIWPESPDYNFRLRSLVLIRSATRKETRIYHVRATLFFTCGEKKIWQNIKKLQSILTMIFVKIFFCFLCLY